MHSDVLPELKEILGSMIFGAERPLTIAEMRRCLKEVAEEHPDRAGVFADVRKKELVTALEELTRDVECAKPGFSVELVAGGYQLQSNIDCSPWLKHLLKMGRPQRLSRPALETMAIIAYRQPVTKAQIEAVRGVSVDSLVKMLMEQQLVRICGRSELPGRPFLYGTTHLFLEHFGLRGLDELNDIEPMLKLQEEQDTRRKHGRGKSAPAEDGEDAPPGANAAPADDAAPVDASQPEATEPAVTQGSEESGKDS